MGGGRMKLLPNTTEDVERPGSFGERLDGRDLIQVIFAKQQQKSETLKCA